MTAVALSARLSLRDRVAKRARPLALAAASTLALGSLASLFAAHLLWNLTPSMPLGLYWLSRGAPPSRGALVAFPVPDSVRELVDTRRYLPPGAVLLKRVAAVEGDTVCSDGVTFSVDGQTLGPVLEEDSAGRPLPHWDGCGPVVRGQVFVASPHPKSFDSRTFGPVSTRDIQATARPLWTY